MAEANFVVSLYLPASTLVKLTKPPTNKQITNCAIIVGTCFSLENLFSDAKTQVAQLLITYPFFKPLYITISHLYVHIFSVLISMLT